MGESLPVSSREIRGAVCIKVSNFCFVHLLPPFSSIFTVSLSSSYLSLGVAMGKPV